MKRVLTIAVLVLALLAADAAIAQDLEVTVVSVGTSATLLYTAPQRSAGVIIRNHGANTIFLGGPTVTTATGYALLTGVSITIPAVLAGGRVYGIVAAATEPAHVIKIPRQQ